MERWLLFLDGFRKVLDTYLKHLDARASIGNASQALSETIWAICSILKAAPAEVSSYGEVCLSQITLVVMCNDVVRFQMYVSLTCPCYEDTVVLAVKIFYIFSTCLIDCFLPGLP